MTSPPRTTVDLTRYIGAEALSSAIEHVLAVGFCTVDTLARMADRMNTPGRPWVRRFLRVLGQRTAGAAAESEGELHFHDALVARGVHGLVRQHKLTLPGYGRARFDLAIPDIRWVLEVDLHPEHNTTEGVAGDNLRDDASTAAGWFVRRVSRAEYDRFNETLDLLLASIERRRAEVARLIAAGAWTL